MKLIIDHLVLQVFGHRPPTVVPLQTYHQELCGDQCCRLGPSYFLPLVSEWYSSLPSSSLPILHILPGQDC